MILETIRMVADALAHEDYGVTVTLASLPLDGDDSAPTAPATIDDETRDTIIARNRTKEDFPALQVMLYQDVELSGEVQTSNRDADVTVLVRHVVQNIDTETGRQEVYYTLRAVEKTIRQFMLNDNAEDRTRNGIQIIQCNSITHGLGFAPEQDVIITGGLLITFRVRDTDP